MRHVNLLRASADGFANLVHEVALLAADDAANNTPPRTGIALAEHFCASWRKGHERHLRLVYMAARWQAETRDP